MAEPITEVLQKRDGLSSQQARAKAAEMSGEIRELAASASSGADLYDQVEQMMMDEGLEMDYIEDLI